MCLVQIRFPIGSNGFCVACEAWRRLSSLRRWPYKSMPSFKDISCGATIPSESASFPPSFHDGSGGRHLLCSLTSGRPVTLGEKFG